MYLPPDTQRKAPSTSTRVEEEVELRVSEDEGGGGGGGVEEEEEASRSAHLRPPSFNPEDYAQALAKYIRTPHVYLEPNPKEKKGRNDRGRGVTGGEARGEMSLRQFSSLPELLKRLREDLKMAYLSFVKELVREPHDGVSLLLDVLKSVQLAQTDLTGRGTSRAQQLALRRALADEHEVLSCLRYCLRSSDAAIRVARYPPGLYTLAVATLSNLPRSRTLALELLTRACVAPGGRSKVVEALATLRLRFAEPVTCKFLVAMMLSHPHPSLQVWALRLMNSLVGSSETVREKVYLQEELTLAGLQPPALRKVIERTGSEGGWKEVALKELAVWEQNYLDVGVLQGEVEGLRQANSTLQDELANLRQANMKLLEENVLLKTVGGEVEGRCAALQRQLTESGLPEPPSPAPSLTDSDLSSLPTFRCRGGHPRPPSSARSCDTETDSVIFHPIRGHDDVSSSDDTVVPSRPPSASSSSLLLPPSNLHIPHSSRSRHHSSPSSTLEFTHSSPLPTPSPAPHGETRGLDSRASEMRQSKIGEAEVRRGEGYETEFREPEKKSKEAKNGDTRGLEVNETKVNKARGKEGTSSEMKESETRNKGPEIIETKMKKAKEREGTNSEVKENESRRSEIKAKESKNSDTRETGEKDHETKRAEVRGQEVKSKPENRFNESRPSPLIDLTLSNDAKSPPNLQRNHSKQSRGSNRQRQQVSEQPPVLSPEALKSPDLNPPPLVSPAPVPSTAKTTSPPGERIKAEGETQRNRDRSSPSSSSSSPQDSKPAASSPSQKKREMTHPASSPLSSSTSSLSSSSSTPSSPGAGQRMDPEYMNVPRKNESRGTDNGAYSEVSGTSEARNISNTKCIDTKGSRSSNNSKGSSNGSRSSSGRNNSDGRVNSDTRGSGGTRGSNEDYEMDYERDVGLYEAVTVAGDRIYIQSTDTHGSHGSTSSSQSSQKASQVSGRSSRESGRSSRESGKGSQTSGGRSSQEGRTSGQESNSSKTQETSVMESVRHYENLAMMSEHSKSDDRTDDNSEEQNGRRSEGSVRSDESGRRRDEGNRRDEGIKKDEVTQRDEGSGDVSEGEVEAVMSGLENVLRSAESSLSLASQETVRENLDNSQPPFEDRASPGGMVGEELEIVPTRVPLPPARSRSLGSPTGTPRDPVLFLEMESPAETSDTETLRNARPDSPHTIETESTQSFGFVRPDVPLRRHETMTERGGVNGSSGRGDGGQRRAVRRCESFQAANSECEYEYDSHRSYSPRHRMPTDPQVPMRETPVHISGRMFTRYTPQEVERRNRVNDMITAELARRKNRSVEDRLDQWQHGHEEDWTLRWRYPEVLPDPHSRLARTRSRTRSPPPREPPRRSRSSSRHPVPPPQAPHKPSRPPKFSNSELIAFSGFRNPNGNGGFRESDYGPNFMLNKPSTRLPDFADYGGRDFPPPLPLPPQRSSRERGGGRRKADFDPDIPTPDYSATPAGTLTSPPTGPISSKHILDMPSGLY
ncbi:hypothetical protein Pcinc_026151 [Petrolisthes cinctipes]|uniref:GBD/FH3 domain-containing protein n=1 Tax=Petrolisthes cinctipes TaxID=88211 RepID=A0AAE1F819_PETCI|nr:hypothetical protein Pcinc_026151 [Petrolisthes cinctipes]